MKITTSFDFGNTYPVNDIGITVNVELSLEEMWSLPDIRKTIADNIAPHLRNMRMNEHDVSLVMDRIVLSGELAKVIKGDYRYDAPSHQIVRVSDGSRYSVNDYLTGKLPDL